MFFDAFRSELQALTNPAQPLMQAACAKVDHRNPDLDSLIAILEQRALTATFQQVIDLESGTLVGYEGLIRWHDGTSLQAPMALFATARAHGLKTQLEVLSCEVVLARFAELNLPGKIFINISPEWFQQLDETLFKILNMLKRIVFSPERIIFELIENDRALDYVQLRHATEVCRQHGIRMAIDDLGEGFSSLRLWSEIRPDFVKIDMHFVRGIDRDPVKQEFVRSIQLIAAKSGTTTIAEGIETEEELMVLRAIGVNHAQGYLIACPDPEPLRSVRDDLSRRIRQHGQLAHPKQPLARQFHSALKVLAIVPVISPDVQTNDVYEFFKVDPKLQTIAVVQDGVAIGLINRFKILDRLARPYQRELFGKRSCTLLMDPDPLQVDKSTTLQELSLMLVGGDAHHLSGSFAINDQGRYIGVGSGADVMREITQMQITAARYANPLTELPGNVPIREEIDRLVLAKKQFVACYADLDNFKPYNDVYGYRRGDDVIQLTANILAGACDSKSDFLGHIGGDDFIILFRSRDWQARCETMLKEFFNAIERYYEPEDWARGGCMSRDRRGNQVFHRVVSLSLGIVQVEAGQNLSSYQISAAATDAKAQAKMINGNSMFVERRQIG